MYYRGLEMNIHVEEGRTTKSPTVNFIQLPTQAEASGVNLFTILDYFILLKLPTLLDLSYFFVQSTKRVISSTYLIVYREWSEVKNEAIFNISKSIQ